MSTTTLDESATRLNLDRSEWKPVKFGDVAVKQNESVDRETTELKRYIAGEHMRSEDLHLREWGEIGEDYLGPAFTRKFNAGDILYGSRRTYLKKVAVAHFEGITANTTFVIKANEDLIVKELLPFVILSEGFTQHSVRNSKGSVNPYINWKDIANFEFLLPPQDQQAKLAELLWAADAVLISSREKYQSLDRSFKSYAKEIASKDHPHSEYKSIKDLCHIKDNLRQPLNSSERASIKGSIPYYGANGVVDHINDFIFDEPLCLLAEDGGNFSEFYFKEIAYRVYGKAWVNNHAHVLTVKNESIPFEWLFYSLVHKNLLKWIIGTTRVKLNKAELLRVPIWVPQADIMNEHINRIQCIETARETSIVDLKSSAQLLKSLINEIFSQPV